MLLARLKIGLLPPEGPQTVLSTSDPLRAAEWMTARDALEIATSAAPQVLGRDDIGCSAAGQVRGLLYAPLERRSVRRRTERPGGGGRLLRADEGASHGRRWPSDRRQRAGRIARPGTGGRGAQSQCGAPGRRRGLREGQLPLVPLSTRRPCLTKIAHATVASDSIRRNLNRHARFAPRAGPQRQLGEVALEPGAKVTAATLRPVRHRQGEWRCPSTQSELRTAERLQRAQGNPAGFRRQGGDPRGQRPGGKVGHGAFPAPSVIRMVYLIHRPRPRVKFRGARSLSAMATPANIAGGNHRGAGRWLFFTQAPGRWFLGWMSAVLTSAPPGGAGLDEAAAGDPAAVVEAERLLLAPL